MAKLRKNIFTVCFENKESKIIYSNGRFFTINENSVEYTRQITPTLKALAFAVENFNLSEEGLTFNYNLKASSIKGIVESISVDFQNDLVERSVKSFQEIDTLKEQLSTLEEVRKQHKLANQEVAVNEANIIISTIKNQIQTLKESALWVSYKYNSNENKTYINNREVAPDNLAEQAFASGLINFVNKPILEMFEIAIKNFDKFSSVQNLVETNDSSNFWSIFRINEKAVIYRFNKNLEISTIVTTSPLLMIEQILEAAGVNLEFMFEDILESKKDLKSKIDAKITETYEIISFLKDQKNILAEANRNIPEIKEAENIINSEITKFTQHLSILENDELTKNDGYMDAVLAVEYESIPVGTKVKVDALDYTTSAKDDMISVILNDKPVKLIKRTIEISSKDTI